MSSLNGDLLLNFSRLENQQFISSELRPDGICEQLEPRVLSAEATAPMDEHLNFSLPESKSSDEAEDVFAGANESPVESSPSSSSYISGDYVPLGGHESSPDGCFDFVQQLGNRNMALVCPDYIIYQGRYSPESVLIFSKESMKLKDSATHGDQGPSRFEWKIEDIIDIQSQWSKRLEIAMVKLRVLMKDAELLVEEMQFAVADVNWPEKQEEIMSLDMRYKALWNVVVDTETERDGQILLGTNGEGIWRKSYFPNFVEFFDEVIYPKGDPDAVSISKRDVDLLQPDIFVNDTIIDFYIKYLKNQMSLEKRNRFHFFNSFFFRKLIDLDKDPCSSFEGKAAFQRVRKWTRKVNLFEKDYVFIPVNYSYHWSLVVICHPGEVTKLQDGDVGESLKVPCILHMDSMKGSHTVLKDIVQSYLWEEWKEKNKDALEDMSAKFLNFRFVSLELPQQPNAYDCGLFLLHYVERFLEEAPLNFSPSKITHYSKFLNFDWFRPEEPCLKRAYIQRLICKILEGEDAPAACSSQPCASDDPANNNAIENNLEFISKRCSPSKSVHGNLSSSQSSKGIEITLLQTASSQNGGDSSLVLREFMEAGASAEPFLDVQCQMFDQAATFGAMGHMEEVEACGQFVYTQSNINPGCADIRKAEHDDFREYPETSIGGSGNSSEAEIQKSNSLENTLVIEERFDEPRSPSAENPTSAPNQMLDVAGFQSGDQILNSHGTADNDLGSLMLPEFASQQHCNAQENGDVTCADIDVVRETLPSETDEQQGSEAVSEILVSETNGMLGLERTDKAETAEQQGSETVSEVLLSETDGMLDVDRIGKDSTEDELVLESDKQLVAKRTGDIMLPESDEQQPAKRLRLDSSPEGEKEGAKVDP